MRRKWLLVILAAVCLAGSGSAPEVMAHHGDDCFYVPADLVGFGCTAADWQLIAMKVNAYAALNRGDTELYRNKVREMITLEQRYRREGVAVHVKATSPLSANQTTHFVMVGNNMRYATAPGPDRDTQRLFIYDKLGREYKVTASYCTNETKYVVNHVLMWLWGVAGAGRVAGTVVPFVSAGTVTLTSSTAAAIDGSLTYLAGYKLSMIPGRGDCEYLVDVLHPQWDGVYMYRNRVVVRGSGIIEPTEWGDGGYWRNFGQVQYINGKPVW